MASVLVVGGAGYVGSSVAVHLLDRGFDVWVLDDLSTGHRALVPDAVIQAGRFIQARAGERAVVEPLLKAQGFDVVLHFAAKSLVAESVKFPELYRENNVDQTRLLLESMLASGIHRFVFSSTAAVYGDAGSEEITEDLPKRPINPYGETKLAVERMLEDYAKSHGLRSIALRYFNAAGADERLRTGEWHEPETHLIPNILAAAMENRAVSVFGGDYPTPDGTCVRDYVHVEDLAVAHAAAVERMLTDPQAVPGFEAFNLGSQSGFSVNEVIAEAERVIGRPIARNLQPRRPGDPAILVANSERARDVLGFQVSPDSLTKIVRSAYEWEKKKRSKKKAVFLDRDGTLNVDPGYLSDADQFELLPGVEDALARLSDAGYLLVVVSNQSGVGRGMITMPQLHAIHSKLDRLIGLKGVRIHSYALCVHHPDEDCDCRKPKPKLLEETAKRYGIDLSQSFMVGDKFSDVEAGRNAGVRESLLVETGYGAEEKKHLSSEESVFVADLAAAVAKILD
jgi:UDP-glucose 4-epimerase